MFRKFVLIVTGFDTKNNTCYEKSVLYVKSFPRFWCFVTFLGNIFSMETDSDLFTKQCTEKQEPVSCEEDIVTCNYIEDTSSNEDGLSKYEDRPENISPTTAALIHSHNYDEPIDLTSANNKNEDVNTKLSNVQSNEELTMLTFSSRYRTLLQGSKPECAGECSDNAGVNQVMPLQYIPKHRGRRRRFELNNMDTSQGNVTGGPDGQHSESNQMEVLKAAKSLFSKRTRTLYHWMYPDAPKAQIKAVVASSWESLGSQEKEFYISQVLGRFGFPHCSLMINPQLGGIKDLPPVSDNDFKPVSNELQSAISSISPRVFYNMNTERHRSLKRKRRQGRPPGSRNRKFPKYKMVSSSISQDFQDDPELSKELEQFALTLNMSNNINLK